MFLPVHGSAYDIRAVLVRTLRYLSRFFFLFIVLLVGLFVLCVSIYRGKHALFVYLFIFLFTVRSTLLPM